MLTHAIQWCIVLFMENTNKPQQYDNSWLGNMGEGLAKLLNSRGKVIGYCLDTPNCSAYAMAINPKAAKVRGILGTKTRKDLADRFWFVVKESATFEKNVRFF